MSAREYEYHLGLAHIPRVSISLLSFSRRFSVGSARHVNTTYHDVASEFSAWRVGILLPQH